MADGFLGRWSQRKQAVRRANDAGKVPQALFPPVQTAIVSEASSVPAPVSPCADAPVLPAVEPPPPAKSTLTLDDVQKLGADADFAPFTARDVAPEVRNAALKKLFTDPHFQHMDRLDIYIDDYSLPSPLSPGVLQKMASAQFLNLVQTPDEAPAVTPISGQATTPVVTLAVAEPAQAAGLGDVPDVAGHGNDTPIHTGCP